MNTAIKVLIVGISIISLSFILSTTVLPDELSDLLARVEALNISRTGYILGKALTDRQKEIARRNAIKNAIPGTYKFKDRDLYVVIDRKTDRVLILYEQYEPASIEKVRELVGALFFDFGEPTVMVHDKVIYWAFDRKGKLSEKDYHKIKYKRGKLKVLATVKLNSSVNIMQKGGDSEAESVYYIISSEPVLKFFDKNSLYFDKNSLY